VPPRSVQQLELAPLEFLVGDDPAIAQAGQLGQLVGTVQPLLFRTKLPGCLTRRG